nr:hypothetical protein [Tanacetum cinerariifolium]
MVFHLVNGVRVSRVEMIYEMDFVRYPQFPLNYKSEPGYIENYNYYPYDSSIFPQQELCCEDCGVHPEADHCQPPQYNVNHPIFNAHNDLLNANNDRLNSQNKITIAQNKLMEQLTSMCAMVGQLIQKKQEEKQIAKEQATNARYWKIPACCDDDDDYNSAITANEPVDSLSMGDGHLKTVPATESDEFIKSYIRLTKRLLYDNLSPRIPEEFVSENSNADIESFSPSPIHVEDSNSFMEEIGLSFNPDDPMPPSIEEDDDDSERDILILEELPSNYSLSLPVNESFYFDIPSFSRPPAKPPDGNTRILNIKIMGDISDQKVPIPNLTITRISNQEKSPNLLSHRGLEIF